VLRGLHRSDLAAIVGAIATVTSSGAAALVLIVGGGVVGMVAVNIPIALAAQAANVWLIRRLAPRLRIGWRGARWDLAGMTALYGTPLSIIDIADLLQRKSDEIVIGASLPVSAVTPFALARGLGDVGRTLTSQFVQVLLPVASELQAHENIERLRALYVSATRLSLMIVLPIGVTLFAFASRILTAWVGPEQADAWPLVVLIASASILASSQSPARWILQGIARHRYLAVAALFSGIANVVLSILLV